MLTHPAAAAALGCIRPFAAALLNLDALNAFSTLLRSSWDDAAQRPRPEAKCKCYGFSHKSAEAVRALKISAFRQGKGKHCWLLLTLTAPNIALWLVERSWSGERAANPMGNPGLFVRRKPWIFNTSIYAIVYVHYWHWHPTEGLFN